MYRYRRFQPGDEMEINKLYEETTGRKRTKEAYLWQWMNAPGGRGEIWLIEAESDKKCWKLIGHHGVMPIRFSQRQNELLFGKTENTFVHPDYRRKILYPRFEERFRKEYEQRFHALFSTTGPTAAIRQRLAQGYELPTTWVTFKWWVKPFSNIMPMLSNSTKKIWPKTKMRFPTGLPILNSKQDKWGRIKIFCFTNEAAKQDQFFISFWKSIKNSYTTTPSRNYEDLKWRFWDNPYIPYLTLLLDSDTAGCGFAVIKIIDSGVFYIDDFIVEFPRSRSFSQLLDATLVWAARNGAYLVKFSTTADSIEWVGSDNFRPRYKNIISMHFLDELKKDIKPKMPRKICRRGNTCGLKATEWYVTPIIFQGVL